jgi:hypothetical protein
MGQIFLGVYNTEQEVLAFNRDLALHRQLSVERRVDEIKRVVLAERRQRERLVQPRRSK